MRENIMRNWVRGRKKIESIGQLVMRRSIVPAPGNLVSALQQSCTDPHLMYKSKPPTTTSAPGKPAPAPKIKHSKKANTTKTPTISTPVRQQPYEAPTTQFLAFQHPSIDQETHFLWVISQQISAATVQIGQQLPVRLRISKPLNVVY